MTSITPEQPKAHPWSYQLSGWLLWIVLVVGLREFAVWVCTTWGKPALANLLGMGALLIVLLIWRAWRGALPASLLLANQRVLKEGGLAFLPLCAGAGALLVALGDALPRIALIMAVVTILPLWAVAWIAQRWLRQDA